MNAELAKKINDTPSKAFVVSTGGGSEWADTFLKHGGGSATLAGFYVPYAMEMTNDFVGGQPRDRYVSDSTARQLAVSAYDKALLTVDNKSQAVGIAVTCSLKKAEGERKGRINHGYAAIQTSTRTISIHFDLTGRGMERSEQELAVCGLIDDMLEFGVFGCAGYKQNMPLWDSTSWEAATGYDVEFFPDINNDFELNISSIFSMNTPDYAIHSGDSPKLIFPGSFNPLHEGHLEMARRAERSLGRNVTFELSIHNFEKASLDIKEVILRTREIMNAGYEVVVTTAPMMIQKANLFDPDVVFVVGYDTYSRISKEDLQAMGENKFLVFSRDGDKVTDNNVGIHHLSYNHTDWSHSARSSDIRKKR